MNHDSNTSEPVSVLDLQSNLLEKVLGEYPNLIAEVDNRAARGVRLVTGFSESSLSDSLMDEEGDLQISLTELTNAYAIEKNSSESPEARLEFDFPDHPALVRLWDIVPREKRSLSGTISSLFSCGSTSLESLEESRETCFCKRPMCPCCEEKAKERARFASIHPLFDILMQATRKPDALRARILSPYADHSLPLRPYQVETHGGVISAVDRENHSAFHVDVRFLHAMRIKKVQLDGSLYAQLIGYNSVGVEIFHLASPNPEDAMEWSECCEWSKQFFTKS
ncbi:MAG: hypothetical protein AAF733_01890 [Verrucomicrobiota bacterium]